MGIMGYCVSERGFFLFGNRPREGERPTLTVEAYEKWYSLYLLTPDDKIKKVKFGELDAHCGDGSPYVDHAPNPNAVRLLADARGWYLDELAYEMIVGRWELARHPERYE